MYNTNHSLVVRGAILAGGRARRMGGVPKGTLRYNGGPSVLEHLLAQTASAGIEETVIVANEPHVYGYLPCEIIPDIRQNMGPMAGIEAALQHSADRCDAVLFLPCDLPEISVDDIGALVDAYVKPNAPVVFAETGDGRRHHLCALVATRLRARVSAAIDAGMLRVGTLWDRLGAVAAVSNNTNAFINLNSPQDVDSWRSKKAVPRTLNPCELVR